MQVYVLRHAKAESESNAGESAISYEGAAEANRAVELARHRFGFAPTSIVSSPVLRARQTAELVQKQFGLKSVVIDQRLSPDSGPNDVLRLLSKFGREDRVVLVSHKPLLFDLLYSMLGEKGEVELPNGSIAAISFKAEAVAGAGKLEWLIQPGD